MLEMETLNWTLSFPDVREKLFHFRFLNHSCFVKRLQLCQRTLKIFYNPWIEIKSFNWRILITTFGIQTDRLTRDLSFNCKTATQNFSYWQFIYAAFFFCLSLSARKAFFARKLSKRAVLLFWNFQENLNKICNWFW